MSNKLSACCSAELIEETDVCSKCKEHSEIYEEEVKKQKDL